MVESYYKTLIRPIDYTAMEQASPARLRKIAIYCRPIQLDVHDKQWLV